MPGRTTLATIVWLMAWAVLHNRWKAREIAQGRVGAVTLILIALGVLATLPPIWGPVVIATSLPLQRGRQMIPFKEICLGFELRRRGQLADVTGLGLTAAR